MNINNHKHMLWRIRSFVHRQRRITNRQQHALHKLWPVIGLDYHKKLLDFNVVFNSIAPINLEIGFGIGSSIITMAKQYPEQNFIGIEVYLPGIITCLVRAIEENIKNIRLIYYDAVDVLEQMIPNYSLSLVQIFFPDPWPKKRHNKRRIITNNFVELIECKLCIGGIFHIVTDWQPYAEHILKIMYKYDRFYNLSPTGDYMERPKNRPLTKFEERGNRLNHNIRDLIFKKYLT